MLAEKAGQMGEMEDMFAQMGDFTAAFGMDKVNFGEFSGYFAIECGNVLGLGGAIFAALLGISALSKEEKEHTSEFLLTHPVSRKRVAFEKLASLFCQIIILNVFVFASAFFAMVIISEKIKFTKERQKCLTFCLKQQPQAVAAGSLSLCLQV